MGDEEEEEEGGKDTAGLAGSLVVAMVLLLNACRGKAYLRRYETQLRLFRLSTAALSSSQGKDCLRQALPVMVTWKAMSPLPCPHNLFPLSPPHHPAQGWDGHGGCELSP